MQVEAMIWTQTDQFTTEVEGSNGFDLVLENERILGYNVMEWKGSLTANIVDRMSIDCRSHFELRSRVRLREQAVGVAIRTNFTLSNASSLSNFPWVQPTMLVRVP